MYSMVICYCCKNVLYLISLVGEEPRIEDCNWMEETKPKHVGVGI